ncbi:MAG TPA: class I SAM-dependent methyltransferase, partial [Roseimicrobium sp.]|nr:class I SAM-dependent methyltransferase [Roseimicrobium sp.]
FYNAFLERHVKGETDGKSSVKPLGMDLGCRGGVVTRKLSKNVDWHGADIDRNAIALANQNGIPCTQMDISIALDFLDKSFDVVVMTEVLEHLPYPTITVREVHRILKPGGAFLGSVPLDYHLHRRWSVMRGRRLTGDITHLHHFSYSELAELLGKYFNRVEFLPLHGTAARHPEWKLSFNHFVRDIAWVAWDPVVTP